MSELVLFAKQCLISQANDNLSDEDSMDDQLMTLVRKEFHKCLIEVSLDADQLSQLDDELPYNVVYFEDDRFPELIKIFKPNPTFRDIIMQLNHTYTNEIIEQHRYLEVFYIKYRSTNFCIINASWGS